MSIELMRVQSKQAQGGRRGDVLVTVHVEQRNNGSLVASVIPSTQLYVQVCHCLIVMCSITRFMNRIPG